MIKSIGDLAEMLGIDRHDIGSDNYIKKELFKSTTCGICFDHDHRGIILSGYCEGTDLECQTHRLDYPYTEDEFWATVTEADTDGMEIWDATHGCEQCWPNGCMDEWDNLFEPGEPGGPVDPDCVYCRGEGVSI